ncbi:hypothetical protein [Streptomyces sp. CC208A]|uniref:hypothetical protein n=1 Tax=Streptomyces sp. CC208A TaxID=3044573 RepID=UPI0024A7F4DF|nr:hypothetical protein [Streptomyces sp. CC208A]
MTTATQLRTIARLWPDLHDALGTPNTGPGFGLGLRNYLAAVDQPDVAEAAVLRMLERSPDQLGTRPIPISLRVLDTMRTVEAALHETADQIASANQHSVNTSHPHRWRYTGHRPGAPWTALWLSARADGVFWPGRPLTDRQHRHVAAVAHNALGRIETTLDLARQVQQLDPAHPCQCGGTITIRGGAGDPPTGHCGACGAWWTENGVNAA